MTEPTSADLYFNAYLKLGIEEEKITDALLEACGVDPFKDIDKPASEGGWPCEDFTFDHYDMSFEFKNTWIGFVPSEEILRKWRALGFMCCWICYTDGTEKAYNLRDL